MSIVASRATLRTSRLAVAGLAATVPLSQSTAVAGGPPLQATDLDTIEVRGERVPLQEQRRLTPGGVTVLDGESFHQRPVANLADALRYVPGTWAVDRKSTRLNSSHVKISYAVFCLKKKNKTK